MVRFRYSKRCYPLLAGKITGRQTGNLGASTANESRVRCEYFSIRAFWWPEKWTGPGSNTRNNVRAHANVLRQPIGSSSVLQLTANAKRIKMKSSVETDDVQGHVFQPDIAFLFWLLRSVTRNWRKLSAFNRYLFFLSLRPGNISDFFPN